MTPGSESHSLQGPACPIRPSFLSCGRRRDLAGIHDYIGQFAPLAARRFTSRLVATVESLAQHPERGRPIVQGVRELVAIRPYIVIYRVPPQGIRIAHTKHGAQRPDQRS